MALYAELADLRAWLTCAQEALNIREWCRRDAHDARVKLNAMHASAAERERLTGANATDNGGAFSALRACTNSTYSTDEDVENAENVHAEL